MIKNSSNFSSVNIREFAGGNSRSLLDAGQKFARSLLAQMSRSLLAEMAGIWLEVGQELPGLGQEFACRNSQVFAGVDVWEFTGRDGQQLVGSLLAETARSWSEVGH